MSVMETLDIDKEAVRHLTELEAFILFNPIVAQAIAMIRLEEQGFSHEETYQAINRAFKERRNK